MDVRVEVAPKLRENLHSARTKGFSFTKAGNVSPVREETSEAEATAAPARPSARVVKVRMLTVCEGGRPVMELLVCLRSSKGQVCFGINERTL